MWCERPRPPSSGSGCSSARARTARTGVARTPTGRCPALGLVTANLVAGHRSTAALHRGRYWHSGEKIAARRLLFHRAGLHDRIPVRWLHLADQPPPDPDLPRWASASQPGGGTGLHVTLRCHDGACLHSQDKVSNINVGEGARFRECQGKGVGQAVAQVPAHRDRNHFPRETGSREEQPVDMGAYQSPTESGGQPPSECNSASANASACLYANASADDPDVFRLGSLLALRNVELDPLPFVDAAVATTRDRAEVHEHVRATLDLDEAVAL